MTLLNVLTIGGPAILIMLSKVPPQAAVRVAFLSEVGRFVLGMGLTLGICGLAVWYVGEGVEERRTLLLSTLILGGLGNVVLVGDGDRRLLAWVVFAMLLYSTIMYVVPTAYFFALTPMDAKQWMTVVIAAIVGVATGWLIARRQPKIDHQR